MSANKAVRQERTFDYLYDPIYTVSSEADHVKASLKASGTQDRLKKVPEFGHMFSNLPHYPSYTVQPDSTAPVPVTFHQRWRGHSEQRKEALHHLPKVSSLWQKQEAGSLQVTGANHWKYFKQPPIVFAQKPPPAVASTLPSDDCALFRMKKNATQQPTYSTVGVQSDYRESETQTDPYSPDYVIKPGSNLPELLYLAPLTWGHGLPAGLAEVELIERTRAKLAWHASLPPWNTQASSKKGNQRLQRRKNPEVATGSSSCPEGPTTAERSGPEKCPCGEPHDGAWEDKSHMMAKDINDIAYTMEEDQNNLQSEEVVSELVYSFLIPESEKINVRKKVHERQHRHWKAACSIIQETAAPSGITSSLGASPWTSPSNQALEGVPQVEQEQGQEQHHTKAD